MLARVERKLPGGRRDGGPMTHKLAALANAVDDPDFIIMTG
jgi:hypothetical protein